MLALVPVYAAWVGKWEPSQLPPGQVLLEPAPLFRKLDDSTAEEELRRITGYACRLKVEMAPERPEDEATASPLGPARTPVGRPADRRSEALHDPLLRYAVEVLEAQVLQVDEGFGTARAVPEDTKPSAEAETED